MPIVDPFEAPAAKGIVDPFETKTPSPQVNPKVATGDTEMQEVYDPMSGMPTGMKTEGPKIPAVTMPYGEQMKHLGQFGLDIGKGATAAVPGMFGDIESTGRFVANKLGADVDPKTVLPTTETIGSWVYGEPEDNTERLARGMGSIAGGLVGPGTLAKGLRMGAEAAIGAPSLMSSRLAKTAENLGFKLEPMQVREAKPLGSPGFGEKAQVHNQEIANRLVTKETGKETNSVTPEFVKERVGTVGKEIEHLFDRPIEIDLPMAQVMQKAAVFEKSVDPAGARRVAATADNLIKRYVSQARAGLKPEIDGPELQRLRSAMSAMSHSGSDGHQRYAAGQIVREIDEGIRRMDPKLGERLQEANRKYRAAITLQDMIQKAEPGILSGNVSLQRLGNHLSSNGAGPSHPLFELGQIGQTLKLRSRVEGPEMVSQDALSALMGRVGRAASTVVGGRSAAARNIQRHMKPYGQQGKKAHYSTTGAAESGKAVSSEDQQ